VYTVRKGTLFEGESTKPEAVCTEFTKVGTRLIKCTVSIVKKTLLLANFGGDAFTDVTCGRQEVTEKRQSMTAASGLHHSALNDIWRTVETASNRSRIVVVTTAWNECLLKLCINWEFVTSVFKNVKMREFYEVLKLRK